MSTALVRYGEWARRLPPLITAVVTARADDAAAWGHYAEAMEVLAVVSQQVYGRDDPAAAQADQAAARCARLLADVAAAHRDHRPRRRDLVPEFEAIPRAAEVLDAMAAAGRSASYARFMADALDTLAEVTRVWRRDPAVASRWRLNPSMLDAFAALYRGQG